MSTQATLPPAWAPDDVNMLDPEFLEDPYPGYAWLREHAPVVRDSRHGFWVVSTHADVLEVLRRPDSFSNNAGRLAVLEGPDTAPLVITSDPPVHTRLRRLLNRPFSRQAIERYRETVVQITSDLIDDIARRPDRRFDLIGDLAFPLPTMVIAELLGIPSADRDVFKRWSDDIVLITNRRRDWEIALRPVIDEFRAYFREVISRRRREPHDDIVSMLVEVSDEDGSKLSEPELENVLLLLLVAGNETTTKLIGNAFHALLRHPDQHRLVFERPELVPQWVEETLRWDAAVQTNFRKARHDLELHGQRLQEGDLVVVAFGSANRDGAIAEDPERFDVTRAPCEHFGFGFGIHHCLGAPLARLESTVSLEMLVTRFPDLRFDEERGPERELFMNVRGFSKLPLRCG